MTKIKMGIKLLSFRYPTATETDGRSATTKANRSCCSLSGRQYACLHGATLFGSDHWSEYQRQGAEVVGISTDTVESHKGFAEKNQLPLRLLSDPDRKVAEMYDMKSWLPGRSARGVVVIDAAERSTYQSPAHQPFQTVG